MADALPNEKLRQYLRELKPEARELLVSELERAQLRGDSPPGASLILEALRSEMRGDGPRPKRVGNPQRLFFAPLEPFLIDDAPERRHQGRIARACLDPIWTWICRDLMPREAKTYTDQVHLLLDADEKNGAEQIAGAFQDLAEQRIRECLDTIRKDDKASQRVAGQIGTPHALDDVRELIAILRVRDALGVIGSRLPPTISNLGEEQLENVKALLDSPIGRHRDVFLYAVIVVMSRLGSPWQLIRLAIHAATSDVAERIAQTPFSVAVDVVLSDLDRMISNLRGALKARRGGEVASLLKDIHDAARALHTEIDLPVDSAWGRQLAASRTEVAELLEDEIDNLPGQVRRLLRPRQPRETRPGSALDSGDVAEIEARLALAATCRNYASELAISEVSGRVHSDLQNHFDSGIYVLLDRLRTSPPAERGFRRSQVDAAVKFSAILFGSDYANLLAKAADIAAKREPKAAEA
jgi:hypothetical protein